MDTASWSPEEPAGIGRGIAERMVAPRPPGRGHRRRRRRRRGVPPARSVPPRGSRQDIRDPGSHREVAAAAARHGVLVAWFNNAGVGDDGALADLTEAAGPPPGRGQPARHPVGDARRDRGVRQRGRRHRQHRVAVRARAGARLQRVRRHQGRDRLAVHVGRRGDAAQRCGCTRCVPTACRPRCSTADMPDALAARPGALRRPDPHRRRGGARRRSTWSAAAGWC